MNEFDQSPVEHARAAAEAIRYLNHVSAVSAARGSYEWPSDVDAVVTELHLAAQRMPQALAQAQHWLSSAHAAGRIGHDGGGDVADAIAVAGHWLLTAAARAERLSLDLSEVRAITSHLTGDDR